MQKKADFHRIASILCWESSWRWMCCLILLGLCFSCRAPETRNNREQREEEKDSSNESVDRIISLAPNITEIIFALGAEEKLVARSQACNYPEATASYPVVKTYPMVDWEQIIYYQPDIVWATDELFSPDVIELLTARDIPIRLQSYRSMADVYVGIKEMGSALGYMEEANSLVDTLQRAHELLVQGAKESGTAMIWISDDPLIVVGGIGYMQDLLAQTGWTNVFGDKEVAYAPSTVEELLFKDPSVIFFPSTREQQIEEIFATYPSLKRLSAYKKNQVYMLEPDLLYRPGPRLIKGIESMLTYGRLDPNEEAE